jgi:hypothetical protein
MRFLLLVAAILVLGASTARGEEAPPPAPPAAAPPPGIEEIARLLRSTVAAERERGETLLVRALRDTPDRAELLERLARTLRADPESTVAPVAPVPSAAPAAAPAAPAGAQDRAEPPVQTVPNLPAGGEQAEGAAGVAAKPAKVATWTLRAWGVSVPAKEAHALEPTGAVQVELENGGQAEASGPAENARGWVETVQRAADAKPLGEASFGLADDEAHSVHLGADLIYRCCVVPSKGGAWAVETGTIDTGLSLRATKTKAGLTVEPVWVTVAQPIATVATRPAPGVDPLELDRPDWSAARTRHVLPLSKERGAGFLVIPGILPDENRRLVLVLELRPK